MAVRRKIRKTGNSTVVSIPKEILEKLNVSEGDDLEFITEKDSIIIQKYTDSDQEILNLSREMFEEYDKTMRDLVNR